MKLLLYYVHIRLVTKELELFNSDPTLPIYSRNTTGYDVMELTKILLKDPPAQKYICTSRPRGVSENATFLIDVDMVCYEDLKTDDMGSWRTKGDHIILLHKIIRVIGIIEIHTATVYNYFNNSIDRNQINVFQIERW